MKNNIALETYLTPFKLIFDEAGVNEVMINRPGEVWVEKKGKLSSRINERSRF